MVSLKPSDSSLATINKFDTTGITTDKESPYVVKNAGVEFNKVNDDGTISYWDIMDAKSCGWMGLRIKLSPLWSFSSDFEFSKIQI